MPYNSDFSDDEDEEARVGEFDEEGELTPILRDDATEPWGWDESTRPASQPIQTFLPLQTVDLGEIAPGRSQVTQTTRDESTPLLKAPPTSAEVGNYGGLDVCIGRESHASTDRSLLRRKSSATLRKPFTYGGQSTYGQTVGDVI